MLASDSDLKARLIAQMAWEAACERLRKALRPPAGYPSMSAEELNAVFSDAAERLHTLRVLSTTPDDRPDQP
ncbi:hypothetical protein ACEN9J_37510 [Variovorax sp. Varisp41]|uniref:hypothetical protein n=1 Tax=Variovorax sp. Varisp41 TaxID=3243033 RepID=UPI0039B57ABB